MYFKPRMGSSTSKPTVAERVIISRLQALDLEKKHRSNEDGFVEVDEFECDGGPLNEKTLNALRRSPTKLDVSQLEDWQTRLLKDPKNRYARLR